MANKTIPAIQTNEGNVGIGTTNPAFRLDVTNSITSRSALNSPRFSSAGTYVYGPTNSPTWIIGNGSSTNNNATAPDGTTSAGTYTLSATSALQFDLYQTISGLTNGRVYTVGMWVKLGTATNFCLVVNNTATWNTIGGKAFTSSDGLSSGKWTHISYTFAATASAAINIHLGYHLETGVTQQTAGTVFIWNIEMTEFSSTWIGNVEDEIRLPGSSIWTSRGNVGIGTTNPTATYGKLSVAGGISILDDNNAKLEIGRYSSAVSNSYIKLGSNSNSLRITNNTDAADIFTILNGGNVGIGVTSPRVLLDLAKANNVAQVLLLGEVGANIRVGFGLHPSNAGMRIFSLNHVTDGGIEFGGISSSDGSTWTRNHRLGLAGGNSFFNEQGGNVGIGTNNPSAKLEVAGSLRVTGVGQIGPAGGYGIALFNDQTNVFAGQIYGRANGLQFTDILGNATVYIASGGNVGIGEQSPVAKLQVTSNLEAALFKGTATFGSAIQIEASSAGGRLYQIQSTANGAGEGGGRLLLVDKTAAATRLTIKSDGTVGIGTTNPTKKLQVAGSLYWDYNGTATEEHSVGIQRVVAAANGSFTEIGTLTASASSIRATFEIFHHDSSTIEYSLFELIANFYTGTTTDWVQLPSRTQAHYAGVANGVVVDARLQTTGGSVELRLRSIGGAGGNMTVNVRIKSNTNLTETSATGTGATVAGLLGFNRYEFPVTDNRFKATYDGLFIKNNGFIGIGSTDPQSKLSISGTNSAIALSFGNTVPNNPLILSTYSGWAGIGMDSATAGIRLVGDYSSATNPLVDIGYYLGGSVAHANWVSRIKSFNNGKLSVGGMASPDTLLSVGGLGSTTAASGLTFGGDAQANLYRAAEDTIKTDGSLNVAGLIYNGNSAYYASVAKSTTANWGQYTIILGNSNYSNQLIQVTVDGGNVTWNGIFVANATNSYRPNELWGNVKLLEYSTYNCSVDDVVLNVMSNTATNGYGGTSLVLKTNGAVNGTYGTGYANNITVTLTGPAPSSFILSSSSWASPYTYVTSTSANTKQIYTNEAGRVGIGTVFPVQKFQIDGTVGNPASVGTTQSGIFRISNTTDNATLDFGIRAGGNGAWLQSTDETSLAANYSLLLNPNGGNVGIGTTNPEQKLHISSSAAFSAIKFSNSTNSAGIISYSADNLYLYTANTQRLTIDTNGNVGIGTTVPGAKLDVVGTIRPSSNILSHKTASYTTSYPGINSFGADATDSNITYYNTGKKVPNTFFRGVVWTGKHYIFTDYTNNRAYFYDNNFVQITNAYGYFFVNLPIPSGYLSPHGAAWDGRYLWLLVYNSGGTSLKIVGYDLDTTNQTATLIAESAVLPIGATYDIEYADGHLYFVKGGSLYIYKWNGSTIDYISAYANAAGTLDAQAITYDGSYLWVTSNGAAVYKVGLDGTPIATISSGFPPDTCGWAWNGSNIVTFDFSARDIYIINTTRLRIDTQNLALMGGRVGIGITNPGDRFQANLAAGENILANIVSNTVSASNKIGFRLSELGAASAEFSLVRDGTTYQAKLQTLSNQPLSFGTSGTIRMVIDGSFVGIGSTTPTALLNVRASVPAGIGSTPAGTNVLLDSNTSNYITFRNSSDNGTYAGLLFLDNNIGGYIAFGNAGAAAASDSMIYGAYQDHIFQNGYVNETLYNRTEALRIKGNGRVGIGTNAPTTLLSVGGPGSTSAASGITFGGDAEVNLYRIGENILKTDGNFQVVGSLELRDILYHYSNIRFLNKAGSNWLTWFTRDTSESEAVSRLDYIRSINTTSAGNLGIGTTLPSGKLHVVSSVSNDTVLRADGTNGTLFSVVDDLSDSLMSVNNSAGLPVLEVFADDRIVMGQYGSGDLVVKNNEVGIGTTNPINKLSVIGNASIGSSAYNLAAPVNGLLVEGSVGIGTTSVGHPLEVYGTSMDPSLTPSAASIFSVNSLGVELAIGRMVTSPFSVWLQGKHATVGGNLTYPIVLNPLGGNVGIGTTNAAAKLDIRQTSAATALKVFTNDTSTAYIAQFIGYDNSLGDTTRMVVQAGGSVGIGRTNPSTLLSIGADGVTTAANGITFGGDAQANIYRNAEDSLATDGNFNAAGNVNSKNSRTATYTSITSGTNGTWYPLFAVGDSTDATIYCNLRTFAHGSVSFIVARGYNLSNTHNITILNSQINPNGGYANVTGVRIRQDGGVEIQLSWSSGPAVDIGVQIIGTNYTPPLVANLTPTANGTAVIDSVVLTNGMIRTLRNIITEAGSVGIGIANPTNKLHIVETTPTGSRIQLGSASTNGLMNAGLVNDFLILTAPFNAVPASTSNNNAKWGIKMGGGSTDSPNALEKSACIYAVSEEDIGAGGAGAGYNRKVGLALHTSPFDLPNVERVRINNLGNVGIGLTNPAYRLQVSGGDVNIASANILRFGTVSVLNTSSNANDIYANIRVLRNESTVNTDGMFINYNSNGTTAAHLRFYANATNERMRIDASNGYVGVGTTVPDVKFDVYDDLNGGNISAVRNANTGSNAYTALVFRRNGNLNGLVMFTNSSNRSSDGGLGNSTIRTDNGKLLLGAGASTYHALETDGNVGIGLTNPAAARLHIKGNGTAPVLRVETADLQSAAGGTAGKTFVGWMPIMTGAAVGDKVFIPLYK